MLKIKVPGHRILVKPEAVEKVSSGGIVIARPGQGDRLEQMGTDRGTVVQVGPLAWNHLDRESPNWQPWCKVGDRVVFARYSGKTLKHPETEEEFFLMNDEDIQVVLEEEGTV